VKRNDEVKRNETTTGDRVGEAPPPAEPQNSSRHWAITGVSRTPGEAPTDHERLEALRERLEGLLGDPKVSARDLAVLAREYRQTLKDLAAVAPPKVVSALDEISARRRKSRGVS